LIFKPWFLNLGFLNLGFLNGIESANCVGRAVTPQFVAILWQTLFSVDGTQRMAAMHPVVRELPE
jgi:hypothetical protein